VSLVGTITSRQLVGTITETVLVGTITTKATDAGRLWQRAWSVTVDTIKTDQLRVEFTVKKTLTANPNTCDLKLYNLSETTRAQIQRKRVPVILVAGYQTTSEIIFSGTARTVDHVREGANWVTHIQCGDGEMAFTDSLSTISQAPGVTVQDQLARIIGDMNINTRDAVAAIRSGKLLFAFPRLQQGYTAQGKTVRLLDAALRPHGIHWSIQNMTLQLLQGSAPTSDTAVLLSPASGLIGSPDHGAPQKDGAPTYIKLKSLLQPSIRPGRVLQLRTQAFNGDYVTQKVEHKGDSHGQEWITEIECLPR